MPTAERTDRTGRLTDRTGRLTDRTGRSTDRQSAFDPASGPSTTRTDERVLAYLDDVGGDYPALIAGNTGPYADHVERRLDALADDITSWSD